MSTGTAMAPASAAVPVVRRRRRVPWVIPAAVALAWMMVVLAELTGRARALHPGAGVTPAGPLWLAASLVVAAWLVMVVAMMLPSSLPLIAMHSAAVATHPWPTRAAATGAFLGGYLAVWGGFGLAATLGDAVLHRMLYPAGPMPLDPRLITIGVLAVAGGFQFSRLKDRCLTECRAPAALLLRFYRRGAAAGWRLGTRHGLSCLGCCWALMLVMVAAGMAHLGVMAALTALMVYEKVGRHGTVVAKVAGVVLLAAAGLVLVWVGITPSGGIGHH